MKKREELLAELKTARELASRISMEIDIIDEADRLPQLKAQYEGKYFKFDNHGYDGVEYVSYYFCKEILPCGSGKVDYFESNPGGNTFSSFNEYHLCYTLEISKEEYYEALRVFTCLLLKMGDNHLSTP